MNKTIAFLKTLDRKAFTGSETKHIVLKFPNTTFEFNGADYVGRFVLPNVYFHITTAYGITDLEPYSVTPGTTQFIPDFFVD